MKENFSINGVWYLPRKRSKKLNGTLTYKPYEETLLILGGSFDDPELRLQCQTKSIIYGLSNKGDKITLCNCLVTKLNNSLSNIPETYYFIHQVIIGKHYSDETKIRGMKIYARFDLLEKWINTYKYNLKFQPDLSITLTTQPPKEIEFRINNDLTGRFSLSYFYNYPQGPEFKLNHKATVEIESIKKSLTLKSFIQIVTHFKKFLIIGIKEEVTNISLSLETNNRNKESKDTIEVYYLQQKPKDSIELVNVHDFMFTYKDISSNFDFIISN